MSGTFTKIIVADNERFFFLQTEFKWGYWLSSSQQVSASGGSRAQQTVNAATVSNRFNKRSNGFSERISHSFSWALSKRHLLEMFLRCNLTQFFAEIKGSDGRNWGISANSFFCSLRYSQNGWAPNQVQSCILCPKASLTDICILTTALAVCQEHHM